MTKAVMLLHGFITDKGDFGDLPKQLELLYDKVYCITFPGHGKNADYSKFTCYATFEKTLHKFDLLKEKYDVVDVIGFSMGGAIATYLTQCREVGKLVLLAPANKFLNPLSPFSSGKFWFNKIFEVFKKISTGETLKNAYKDSLKVYMENEKITIDMAVKRLIPNYTYKTLSTFNKIIKKCNEDLSEIENEMLVVWGNLDQLVPIESPRFLMSICTNKRKKFIELKDISHLMLASKNSQYVMKDIIEFLKPEADNKEIAKINDGEIETKNERKDLQAV